MVTRRRVLVTAGITGVSTVFAGCGGSEQSSEEDESTDQSSEENEEDENGGEEAEILQNFTVEGINFSFGFTDGLGATVELTNVTERGSGVNTANVAIEAYNGEELAGSDNEWDDIQATFTTEYELTIEGLSQIADKSLDDVTDVLILGKTQNEEYVELNSFSGDEIRSRVGQ